MTGGDVCWPCKPGLSPPPASPP